MAKVHQKVVWANSVSVLNSWIARDSGGDQVGQHSGEVPGQIRWMGNPGSGNTVGNIGLLPSLTRIIGRGPCCSDVLLPARPSSGVIQGGMLVWHWRTDQQHLNSPSHRICSGHYCSRDCGSLSSSRRQRAKDARLP